MFLFMCGLCKGIEVRYQSSDIRVVCVGFETETMLERHGVAEDEIHGCDFLQEIVNALLAFALLDMDPDVAPQVAALD